MANELLYGFSQGFRPMTPSVGNTTLALSTTNTALGFAFNPLFESGTTSKTINAFRVRVSAVTGTLSGTSLTLGIYTDNGGIPGTLISSTTTYSPNPSGAAWIDFTGLSASVNVATPYWGVLTSSDATNYPTISYLAANGGQQDWEGSVSAYGWYKKHSTTGVGGTWANAANSVGGFRIGFSDSTYQGFPFQSNPGGTDKAYGSNEVGIKFTTPANAALNVRGLSVFVNQIGAISGLGNLTGKLYNGTTLIGSASNIIPKGNFGGGGWYPLLFTSNTQLPANTVCRATIAMDSGGDASHYYYFPQEYVIDSDSNSLALLPFAGTMQKTTYNGSTWTDTNTSIFPFELLPATDGEFSASGGGGGPVHPIVARGTFVQL